MKGLKYRTVGLAADLMQAMGLAVAQLPGGEIVPAMERGVIDAFEFNNPTSDRRFGAQDVAKNYMLGSYHQATEYFEIMFNKAKVNVLRTPKDVFEAQIKAWDGLIVELGKDPFMKKVMDSQKEWSKRVVYYEMFNAADYRTAYEHHFGKLAL